MILINILKSFPSDAHMRMHACPVSQSCWTLCNPQTVARQSMGFSGQEYWSGLPRPPPGDLPDPGIKPMSLVSPALACGLYHFATWEAPEEHCSALNK